MQYRKVLSQPMAILLHFFKYPIRIRLIRHYCSAMIIIKTLVNLIKKSTVIIIGSIAKKSILVYRVLFLKFGQFRKQC